MSYALKDRNGTDEQVFIRVARIANGAVTFSRDTESRIVYRMHVRSRGQPGK